MGVDEPGGHHVVGPAGDGVIGVAGAQLTPVADGVDEPAGHADGAVDDVLGPVRGEHVPTPDQGGGAHTVLSVCSLRSVEKS